MLQDLPNRNPLADAGTKHLVDQVGASGAQSAWKSVFPSDDLLAILKGILATHRRKQEHSHGPGGEFGVMAHTKLQLLVLDTRFPWQSLDWRNVQFH